MGHSRHSAIFIQSCRRLIPFPPRRIGAISYRAWALRGCQGRQIRQWRRRRRPDRFPPLAIDLPFTSNNLLASAVIEMFTNTKSLFISILKAQGADCVCDIGSRDGDQSLLFRHLLPNAAAIAFEANP